jgi:hypothetical protein
MVFATIEKEWQHLLYLIKAPRPAMTEEQGDGIGIRALGVDKV